MDFCISRRRGREKGVHSCLVADASDCFYWTFNQCTSEAASKVGGNDPIAGVFRGFRSFRIGSEEQAAVSRGRGSQNRGWDRSRGKPPSEHYMLLPPTFRPLPTRKHQTN